VDWFASVFVLRFCLLAFGAQVGLTTVITGFVIGIMVGLASLVPGGLVFQEGSMTWVLVLLTVELGQAILAAILFRGIFFYLPYLFSLLFYRHLLKPANNLAESLPGEVRIARVDAESRLSTNYQWSHTDCPEIQPYAGKKWIQSQDNHRQ